MYNGQNNANKWRGRTPWAQEQHGEEETRQENRHLIRISSRQSQHDHDLRGLGGRNVFGNRIDHAPYQYQRSVENSRSESYTEGFGTPPVEDDDDEPNDVVVCQGHSQCQYRRVISQRSLSDTDDRLYTLPVKATLTKSRSIKSLSVERGSGARSSNGNMSSEDYENHLMGVTKQLELIKTTQDSILAELSDDISNLQFENVQLKNTNEHLTMQNSHLLQVIADLSNEVEHMREVFRIRGWSLGKLVEPEVNKLAELADQKQVISGPPNVEQIIEEKRKTRKVPVELQVEEKSPQPAPDDQLAAMMPREEQPRRRRHNHSRSHSHSSSSRQRTSKDSIPAPRVHSTKNTRPTPTPVETENDGVSSCFKKMFRRNKKASQQSIHAVD